MPAANYSSGADLAFASAYSILFVGGLPLNVAALCVFCFGGVGSSTTAVYMKNLAACDLLLLTSLPLRAYYYSRRPQLPQSVCEAAGLVLFVNMYSSIFLLTCISWDRCMALCFLLSPRAQAVRQQAKYICAGAWAWSLLGTVPTYFVPERGVANRTLCFDGRPEYVTGPAVSSAMVLCFALPLAILVTCSGSLLRAVHQSTVVQMELVNGAKIRHMVLNNVAIFLGCFLPYHVTVLCYQVPALDGELLAMAYQCALLLACANATLDPLAYYFATETFQHLVTMDHLRGSWGSRHAYADRGGAAHPAPGEHNTPSPPKPQLPSGTKTQPLTGHRSHSTASVCEEGRNPPVHSQGASPILPLEETGSSSRGQRGQGEQKGAAALAAHLSNVGDMATGSQRLLSLQDDCVCGMFTTCPAKPSQIDYLVWDPHTGFTHSLVGLPLP